MSGLPSYPDCPIQREPPLSIALDKDIAKNVAEDYRVLPLFEKCLFEYKYRRHYSLQTNKFLHCRWRSYINNYQDREFAPFNFVDIRDFHFCNSVNRLLPEKSIHRIKEFPYKLGLGPGVDFYGQVPIPQDIMMRRGLSKPRAKGNIYPKNTNESQNEIKDKK